ncbi:hypothetical protein SDC9_100567 [bioreactor metagenome]|uniref:Uncharacterized protein n=1 Tax=bioreactor metagenome TaxID=1076179 RepID=A0A645AM34_9ZZZZ
MHPFPLIQGKTAIDQCFAAAAQAQKLPVKVQHAVRVTFRRFYVDCVVVRVDHQPRGSRCEACVPVCAPLHRHARVVPPFLQNRPPGRVCLSARGGKAIKIETLEIANVRNFAKRHIRHAQFLPLIEKRCPAQEVHRHTQHLCRANAQFLAFHAAEAGDGARLIMIRPKKAVPAGGKRALPVLDDRLEPREIPRNNLPFSALAAVDVHQVKRKHHVQLVLRGIDVGKPGCAAAKRRFADAHAVPPVKAGTAHLL